MDKKAFGSLVMANEKQLYRIARSILKRDEDCADAAQEAITKGFEKLHTLRKDAYAKTWLIRILIHECYRIAEKREREASYEEKWESRVSQKADYSGLYEALLQLAPEFRVVVVLYYVEGFSVEEISNMLDIPHGTVKSRLYRGREKLRELLTEEG